MLLIVNDLLIIQGYSIGNTVYLPCFPHAEQHAMIPSFPLSVIVPVYNAGKYLRETLESICSQTHTEMEIICVDDGSTDNSGEILRDMASLDDRIKIIHQTNSGPGTARNTGMCAAKGEYVAFLDADDLYEPDMLAAMYSRAEQHHADVVMCLYDLFETSIDERYKGLEVPEKWLDRAFCPRADVPGSIFQICIGWPWDKIFRTEYIRSNGWDYPPLRNSEDGVFIFPAVAHAKTMVVSGRILVHHRIHPGSVSKTLNLWPTECIKAIRLIHERLGDLNQNPAVASSFSEWARRYAVWNMGELPCETRPALHNAIRNILEPLLKLSGSHSSEYRDYRALASPDARVEIQVGANDLPTLRECIRSIKEQENALAEIVVIPQNCSIPEDLLDGIYISLPDPPDCPVFRLPAHRGLKWNALSKAIQSAGPSHELPAAFTYDIRKRARFYAHTATLRTWRLWGHGILTLQKTQHSTGIFILGHRICILKHR